MSIHFSLILITLMVLISSNALATSSLLLNHNVHNVQHKLSSSRQKVHSFSTKRTSSLSEHVGLVLKANEYRSYEIVKRIKRNQLYFIEGFAFVAKSTLIESTGQNGRSEVHFIDINTMNVSKSYKFDESIFGEGCALVGKDGEKKVLVMTYQNNKVFELDENLENIKRTLPLPFEMMEGWGMAKLNEDTILTTDGSNKLFHIDPETFTVKKTVEVNYEDGTPAYALNELEVINGQVFANVFMKNNLLIIDPESGNVLENLDLQGLVDYLESEPEYLSYTKADLNNCLNGIAFNEETNQLFVTGKNWPYIYEIKLNSVQ